MRLNNEQIQNVLSSPIIINVDWSKGTHSDGVDIEHYIGNSSYADYRVVVRYSVNVLYSREATHTHPAESEEEIKVDEFELYVYSEDDDDFYLADLTKTQEETIINHITFE